MKVYLVLNISVNSVVGDRIIFHVLLKISAVSAVSKINIVIVISDRIIFHVVLKINRISIVSSEIIFYVL